jgi:hypothetical protein
VPRAPQLLLLLLLLSVAVRALLCWVLLLLLLLLLLLAKPSLQLQRVLLLHLPSLFVQQRVSLVETPLCSCNASPASHSPAAAELLLLTKC